MTQAKKNKWVAAANAACYLPYIGPDIMQCAADIVKGEGEGPWYDVFNDVCSGLGQLKAFVNFLFCWKDVGDKQALAWSETASPVLDCIINACWEAPTIGAFVASDKKDNDIAGLLGNTFFNLTGVMSPAVAWCTNPEAKLVLVLTSGAMNVAYGLISLGLAVDTVSAEESQV